MIDASVTNLLASIRDVSYVGTSTRDWDDTKLIRLLNREVDSYLMPMMMAARENHNVTYTDQTLVANQNAYYLPAKATGAKARAVQLVDSATSNPYYRLVEYPLEEAINFGSTLFSSVTPNGIPTGYYWRGNQLVLFPTPRDSSYGLRIYYVARPSELVPLSSCMAITGFPGGAAAGFFRVGYTGTLPTTFNTPGQTVDLVQNVPGFDVLASAFVINAISAGAYVELTGIKPPLLAAGDWITQPDRAPVVTGAIPDVVVGCLVLKVTLQLQVSKSDQDGIEGIRAVLKIAEAEARQFLNRRNTGDRPHTGIMSLSKFSRGTWARF